MIHQNLPNIEKFTASISSDSLQYLVYTGLSLGILVFTGILYFSNKLLFKRFLGRINPLIAVLFVIILGFVLLSFLLSQQWFAIYEKENMPKLLRLCGLAALLGLIMIVVDTKIVFSPDMNILFPESLLFYPVMGFVVEILFHVLPLTLLLVVVKLTFKSVNFNTLVLICILSVALLEPIYQMMGMVSAKRFPLWAVAYVGFHVFLINFFQLLIFKELDFISMYSFRLVYYLFWHIGWGYLRLGLLF